MRVTWRAIGEKTMSMSVQSSNSEAPQGQPQGAGGMLHGAEIEPVYFPEKSRKELLVVAGIFTACCLYFRLYYNYTTLNPVEGIIPQGAQRILNGEVLYRDFFSFYTPGSYYWMALLFRVFGDSILVPRAALIVYGGIFSVLTYLLARRVCSRTTALLTVYLLTLTCLPFVFFPLHNWDSTLWALVALYFAVRFLEAPHWGFASAAGAFTSLTYLFEQSKGAGLALGLAMGFGAIILAERGKKRNTEILRSARDDNEWAKGDPREGRSRGRLRHLWAFLLAFALPVLITVAYFAAQHGLPEMLADWLWPLQHSTAVRNAYGFMELPEKVGVGPWGYRLALIVLLSPWFIVLALPVLAVGPLGYWLLRLKRGEQSNVSRYYILVAATLVGLLVSTLASRPDFVHFLFQAPMFFVILAWGLDKSRFKSRLDQDTQSLVKYYIFLSFTALGVVLLGGPLRAHTVLETRRGELRAAGPDPALQELQARVRPGQKILVYPFQPLYYYLTSTSNPTRYEFLHLGMHTPEQFAEAMRELAADRTPLVLFQPSFSDIIGLSWPGTPTKVLAQRDPVMEYVLANYRACTARTALQSWQIVFLVRKDLSCTGPL